MPPRTLLLLSNALSLSAQLRVYRDAIYNRLISAEGILEPMELAHLPYKNGKTYEDYVGVRGLKRLGKKSGGATWPTSWNSSRKR